jgi:hypothetical protein
MTLDRSLPLHERLAGSPVTSRDGYWDVARAAWVRHVDRRPSAVVHAESPADVVAPVDVPREHGVRVTAQRTGRDTAPVL